MTREEVIKHIEGEIFLAQEMAYKEGDEEPTAYLDGLRFALRALNNVKEG